MTAQACSHALGSTIANTLIVPLPMSPPSTWPSRARGRSRCAYRLQMHRPSTISTAWWRLPSGWDRQSAQSGVAEVEFSTTHTLNSAGRPTVRPGAFTLGAAGEKGPHHTSRVSAPPRRPPGVRSGGRRRPRRRRVACHAASGARPVAMFGRSDLGDDRGLVPAGSGRLGSWTSRAGRSGQPGESRRR
jgi:hypothetical protein